MNRFYKNSGFTLIELLVIISIIGLLSSIALASLSTSKVRAADAVIKSDLIGIRTLAELEASSLGNSYNKSNSPISSAYSSIAAGAKTNTILQNTSIQALIDHIKKVNGNQDVTVVIPADGKTYDIVAPIKTTGSKNILSSSNNGNITTVSGVGAPVITKINYDTNLLNNGYYHVGVTISDIVNSGSVSYVLECKGTGSPCISSNYTNPDFVTVGTYVSPGTVVPRTYDTYPSTGTNGTYTFRVRAKIGNVFSPYSNEIYILLPFYTNSL